MRKSFLLLLFFVFLSVIPVRSDNLDDFADVNKAWDAQKVIPNTDYEEVVNALQEKKDKIELKKKKKKFKKLFSRGGTTLHKELNPDKEIKDVPIVKTNKDGVLTNIYVDLLLDGKVLEKGYYKIYAERDEQNRIYVKFYQSQFLKGEIIAEETQDDYGEDEIDFARILPYNDSFVKIIFGSIDFNAYAYVPFLK